jgi:hypothetical protein
MPLDDELDEAEAFLQLRDIPMSIWERKDRFYDELAERIRRSGIVAEVAQIQAGLTEDERKILERQTHLCGLRYDRINLPKMIEDDENAIKKLKSERERLLAVLPPGESEREESWADAIWEFVSSMVESVWLRCMKGRR